MLKNAIKLFLISVLSVSFMLFNVSSSDAEGKNAVVMVYASWSVVSRDLRPVASNVAKSFKYPYVELDIDNPNTQVELKSMNLVSPNITPFIAVIHDGKVTFKKTYPNSTPAILKNDLTGVISKFF